MAKALENEIQIILDEEYKKQTNEKEEGKQKNWEEAPHNFTGRISSTQFKKPQLKVSYEIGWQKRD